jgi:hypothetical protein
MNSFAKFFRSLRPNSHQQLKSPTKIGETNYGMMDNGTVETKKFVDECERSAFTQILG